LNPLAKSLNYNYISIWFLKYKLRRPGKKRNGKMNLKCKLHEKSLLCVYSFVHPNRSGGEIHFIARKTSQKKTFKVEYLEIPEKNGVEFDHKYLFEFFPDI
jgi:hypothetical protein